MTEAWKKNYRQFLVDSEIRKGRHSVIIFVFNNLTAQVIEEKLDRVLDKLKCSAKLNLVLGFVLKNTEDGRFGYFYAHENNTPLKQPKLWVTKTIWQKKERDFQENRRD